MANSKYDFEWLTAQAPVSKTAKAEALPDGGPLNVAAGHWAATILPDAFDKEVAAPNIRVTVHALEYVFLPGSILSPELRKAGMHWAVEPARFCQYMKDLDATAFDTTPIPGTLSCALPILMRRVREHMIAHLSVAQRTLNVTAVCYDAPLNTGGETDTWYDYTSPTILLANDSDSIVVSHFKMLMPYSFCADDRASDYFKSCLKGIEGGVKNPAFSEMDEMTQASLIVMHIRSTRPPLSLDVYMPIEAISLESARRGLPDAAARYIPLFEVGWRPAYFGLSQLWPHEVQNCEVATDTSALAVALNISQSGTLSDAIVTALSTKVSLLVSRISTDAVTNKARTESLTELESKTGSPATSTASATLSAEETKNLYDDQSFINLQSKMLACGQDDYLKTAKVCMEADHPAGILFVAGKCTPSKEWRARSAASNEAVIQTVLTTAISTDPAGVQKEWGSVLPEGAGKKWLLGGFDTNHWKLLETVCVKREGVAIKTWYTGKEKENAYMLDPDRLRYVEAPLKALFAAIGVTGSGTNSWHAFHRSHLRLAGGVQTLPPSCAPAAGLATRLIEVVNMVYKQYAQSWRLMIATTASAARRPPHFLGNGEARNALIALESRFERIKQDCDDGMYGYAVDPSNNRTPRNAAWEVEEEPEAKRKRDEDAWGHAAKALGISVSQDGTQFMFGQGNNGMFVQFNRAPDLTNMCVAQLAPNKKTHRRNTWCPSPGKCWHNHGNEAHARHAAFGDDVCVACPIPAGVDTDYFRSIKSTGGGGAADGGGRSASKKSSGKGGKGRGGRGGGGRGGYGGGIGKGKGKGQGGGKGKGRGKGNFGWQG